MKDLTFQDAILKDQLYRALLPFSAADHDILPKKHLKDLSQAIDAESSG